MNTSITGLITPFTKLDKQGYFHSGKKEPYGKMDIMTDSLIKFFNNNEKAKEFNNNRLTRRELNYGNINFTPKKIINSKKIMSFKLIDNKVKSFTFEFKNSAKHKVYDYKFKRSMERDTTGNFVFAFKRSWIKRMAFRKKKMRYVKK